MPSPRAGDGVVRFGVFELDRHARLLRKQGRRVRLQDKPLETLMLFLERGDAIVTREELRQRLWPADTFVVFDDSLNTAIRKLREALGDSAESPRFIETIPRHGYRFIGPIERTADLGADVSKRPRAPTANEPTQPHGSRRHAWAWLTLLLATAGAGVAWHASRSRSPVEPTRVIPLTTFPGAELYPSLSPDGSYVAFTWASSKHATPNVYVQMIGSGPPLRLTTGPHSDFNPVWSPDGRWIAFLRSERLPPPHSGPAGKAELRLIPPLGGPERRLADINVRRVVGDPGFLAWCPDSTCLVATDSSGEGQPDALFVVSLETGGKRQLTQPRAPLLGDCHPAVSPDGRSLVFRRLPAGSSGELQRAALGEGMSAAGELRRLTPGRLNAEFPAWTPDGREILFSSRGRLWRLAVAGTQPGEAPVQLSFAGEDGSMPVLSRPSPGRLDRLVYARHFKDSNIWRVEPAPSGSRPAAPPAVAISSTRTDINPNWSPDGRRVAFASTRSGGMEIWLADPDGGNAVQLTSMASQTTCPRWSPDGQRIAFQSNRDGQFDVYVIPAAGGAPRNLTSHPANDHVPTFSRDGRFVYFGSTRTGAFRIFKVPASGGEAVQVTNDDGFLAVEATDGNDIYYTQGPGLPTTLRRMPTRGGQAVDVLRGVIVSAFAVVDGGIYYVDRQADETRLQRYDFAARRSTTVVGGLGEVQPLITASPDGRSVLFARVDVSIQDLMLVENFR